MMSSKDAAILILMLISAVLGAVLRPSILLADELPLINLQTMIPVNFGEWQEEANLARQVINPQQEDVLNKIYSQTLSRTYVNSRGYRVMLSIAYGKNQGRSLQLHRPEVCYPAQGFLVMKNQIGTLNLLGKPIAVTRLQTKQVQRVEPITYWTVVGDQITKGAIDKKIVEIGYAFRNNIPDGMLVRISSIDSDVNNAYEKHRQFADAMIEAIPTENRIRFAGRASSE